jgi:hypothetical protein
MARPAVTTPPEERITIIGHLTMTNTIRNI